VGVVVVVVVEAVGEADSAAGRVEEHRRRAPALHRALQHRLRPGPVHSPRRVRAQHHDRPAPLRRIRAPHALLRPHQVLDRAADRSTPRARRAARLRPKAARPSTIKAPRPAEPQPAAPPVVSMSVEFKSRRPAGRRSTAPAAGRPPLGQAATPRLANRASRKRRVQREAGPPPAVPEPRLVRGEQWRANRE
jgi:hypothetical protein